MDTIILRATGAAMNKACVVALILRRRIKDIHQINDLTNVEIVDEYEPLEEGLDRVVA